MWRCKQQCAPRDHPAPSPSACQPSCLQKHAGIARHTCRSGDRLPPQLAGLAVATTATPAWPAPRWSSSSPWLAATFAGMQDESPFFQELKASQPFFLMAGPNVIQSEAHALKMCRQIKAVTGAWTAQMERSAGIQRAHSTHTLGLICAGCGPYRRLMHFAMRSFQHPTAPRPPNLALPCCRQPGHQAGVQELL